MKERLSGAIETFELAAVREVLASAPGTDEIRRSRRLDIRRRRRPDQSGDDMARHTRAVTPFDFGGVRIG